MGTRLIVRSPVVQMTNHSQRGRGRIVVTNFLSPVLNVTVFQNFAAQQADRSVNKADQRWSFIDHT